MRHHLLFILFSTIFLSISCQEKESEEPVREITEIKTEYSHYEIMDGEFLTINVIHSPEDLPAPEYDLTVADPEVLSDRTISELMIRGRNPGESMVTICVKDNPAIHTTCLVTVLAVEPESISLDKSSVELIEGEQTTLTAVVSPGTASNKNITWSSSDETVAVVTDGVIKGLGAGTAIITASTECGSKTATCEVTVIAPVVSVSLNHTLVEMEEGRQITLTAIFYPSNATNQNVIWSSSNESIVTVSDGVITALKPGVAVVSVTTEDGAKTASCQLTISPKVESIILSPTSAKLYEDEILNIETIILPDGAKTRLIWSSSDPTVAIVSNGKVTALNEGNTTIHVATEDGEITAECHVTVQRYYYIDEYGVNHGEGVKVGSYIWAPVNCGYHAIDYPYGKLYQWGRKYGQGLGNNYDNATVVIESGPVSYATGQSKANENIFYTGGNSPNILGNIFGWEIAKSDIYSPYESSWSSYSGKGKDDPCPEGWRVPSIDELTSLASHSYEFTTNSAGIKVMTFASVLSLPIAGGRNCYTGELTNDAQCGYYWSYTSDGWAERRYLCFDESGRIMTPVPGYHSWGFSVRCVREK